MRRIFSKLADSISSLASEITGLREQRKSEVDWFKSHINFATRKDLMEIGQKIMSKISDFAKEQNAHNDRMDAAVQGLEADVKALNDKIIELQNTPGEITPEDQA